MKWRKVRDLRGLVVDIENAPSTYGGGDYVFPRLTAIGCQFIDDELGYAWTVRRDKPANQRTVAKAFRKIWDQADFIVGHNFRRHDMKILDGFYASLDLPLLDRKRIVDTYLDQPKMAGYSRSLENLASRWDCPERKMSLSEFDWQRAYDGVPAGVALMKKRVASDVRINLWLFEELKRRELLKW